MINFTARNKQIAFYNSLFVIALSLLILFCWHFDLVALIRLFPGRQISNPVTALCFLMSALSFLFYSKKKWKLQNAAFVLGVLVLVIGMVRLLEVLFHYSTGIDTWLYSDKLTTYGNYGKPNFMAPNTAFGFFMLGSALCFYQLGFKRLRYLSDLFSIIVLLISFLSLVGYLYKSLQLYHIGSFIPMAFNTALSFMLVSLSVLLGRSKTGVMRLFTLNYEGSKMARFLLPFAVLVPIITGWLRFYGEDIKLFDSHFGITLFAVINVIVFVLVIWWSSINLNKSAVALRREMVARKRLDEQLLHLNKKLEEKVEERTQQLLLAEEAKAVLEKAIMQDKIQNQKKMMQAALEGQEKEKKQIGMELHDHINQVLAASKLTLEIAKADPELKDEMIDKAGRQIMFVINEIRNLSKSLVAPGLESEGIEDGIREFVEIIKRSTSIEFTTNISHEALVHLEKQVQYTIYRIIQEQLNNIVKHADASHVILHLYEEQGRCYLLIEDDGKGFDPNSKKEGIGISNIRNRVDAFDGDVEITSASNKGCRLKLSFPLLILPPNRMVV